MKVPAVLFLFLFVNNSHAIANEMVNLKVSDTAASIFSLNKIKEISRKFDKKEPLNSYLEIEASATVEGNNCGFSKFSIQQKFLKNKDYNNEKSYVTFNPITDIKKTIPMESEVCTQESINKNISTRLRISLNAIDGNQQFKTWEYIFKDQNKIAGRVLVKFSRKHGWSFKQKVAKQ